MSLLNEHPLWFITDPDTQPPERIRAAKWLVEAVTLTETAVFWDAIEELYGSLSDEALYDVFTNSYQSTQVHLKGQEFNGREIAYFYDHKFIVGFSERWMNDEMVVSVRRPDVDNTLFAIPLRNYYDRRSDS